MVMECLKFGLDVFMEINLIGDWYKVAAANAKERGVKLFISSTPVYRRETQYIADAVHGSGLWREELSYCSIEMLFLSSSIN